MIKSLMIFMNPSHVPLGQHRGNYVMDQSGFFSLPLSLLLYYLAPHGLPM